MYYDPENWMNAPAYENSGIDAVYRSVVQQQVSSTSMIICCKRS